MAILNANQTFTASNKFSANSTSTFSIQNAAGTSNLLIADTISSRIGIATATPAYTLDVNGDINSSTGIRVGGALLCSASGCSAASGSANYIQNGTALQSANFNISSATTNSITAIIRALTTQTADLLQLKDQAGVNILTIGPTGNTLVQPSTNSVSAFQVLNANSTSHLIVGDTLNAKVAIALPSPTYTLDVGGDINSATGLRVAGNLVCSTVCTPGGGSGNYIQNGTTVQTANFAIQSDLNSHIAAYIRGASGQSADLLDIVGKGAGDTNLPIATFGSSGNILFQNAIDSTTAFQLQNLAGNNYLLVNTSGASVSLGNTGIASTIQIGNTTGAVAQTINIGNNATASSTSAVTIGNLLGTSATTIQGGTGASAIGIQAGASGTISVGTTNVNTVTVGSTANTGTLIFGQSTAGETINIGNGNVATGNTNNISIGATATSTGKDVVTIGSLIAASTLTLQGGNTSSAVSIQSAASGTVSLGSSGVANTIQIGNTTGAVAQTINIGNNATGTNTLVIGSTSGTSPLTLQAGSSGTTLKTTSTTAFVIQKADGTGTIFTADTSGVKITLGSASATPTILVLGVKNDNATDPTCTAGAIYYNSTAAAFRGCQDVPSGYTNLGNPVGTILAYGGSSAPSGYLIADGSAISRTTYATLFAIISTTYGTGDGSTTFNLPDLRGRTAVGLNSSNTDVSTLGNNEGAVIGSRTPKHKHTVVQPTINLSSSPLVNTPPNAYASNSGDQSGSFLGTATATGGTVGPQTNAPTDSGAYLTVNYIIKY